MSGETSDDIISGEARIIAEFLAPLTDGDAGAFGLLDDCAVVTQRAGEDLVVTTDSLIEGLHFLAGDVPAFKALAVNVSDLVAKGARPFAYLLTLALPKPPTRGLMMRIADDLRAAQTLFGCRLIGGDTDHTPGPFTLTIAAIGSVPAGRAVRRQGAQTGDVIVVTGTIGDAGLGLRLRKSPERGAEAGLDAQQIGFLFDRFDRPVPPIGAAELVREFASAAMDVSDGLAKDLARLCAVSAVGAVVEIERVPISAPARVMIESGAVSRADLVTGGEDYEVVMTVAREHWPELARRARGSGVVVSEIGEITAGREVQWWDRNGQRMSFERSGFEHF